MAPGRQTTKLTSTRRQQQGVEMSDYEIMRMENIRRNSRHFQRLGIQQAKSLLQNAGAKPTGTIREGRDVSGSLYTSEESDHESEDYEDEVVISKVANDEHTKNPTRSENTSVRGIKASKRVVAPQEQDVPKRVTRQKTRDLVLDSNADPQQVTNLSLSNTTPTPDMLVSGSDPSLQQDFLDIIHEG